MILIAGPDFQLVHRAKKVYTRLSLSYPSYYISLES
jgi:hypothetical protein